MTSLGRFAINNGYLIFEYAPGGGEQLVINATVKAPREAGLKTVTFGGRESVEAHCLPPLAAWIRGFLCSLMETRDKANAALWQQKKYEYLGPDGLSGKYARLTAIARADIEIEKMGGSITLGDPL